MSAVVPVSGVWVAAAACGAAVAVALSGLAAALAISRVAHCLLRLSLLLESMVRGLRSHATPVTANLVHGRCLMYSFLGSPTACDLIRGFLIGVMIVNYEIANFMHIPVSFTRAVEPGVCDMTEARNVLHAFQQAPHVCR